MQRGSLTVEFERQALKQRLQSGLVRSTIDVQTQEAIVRKKMGAERDIAETLDGIAVSLAQANRTARLFSAAASLREAIGAPVPTVERAGCETPIQAACIRSGDAAFDAAWVEGRAMALEQPIGYAPERADG